MKISHVFMFLLLFLGRQKRKKSSKRSYCKNDDFPCEISIFGLGGQRGRVLNGPFEGDPRFHFFMFFDFCFFFFSFFFLSNIFHCQHSYHGSTKDVSSVVGAPGRRGALMTWGGIAGIGLDHLPGREHDSTTWSGVEAPRGANAETERP